MIWCWVCFFSHRSQSGLAHFFHLKRSELLARLKTMALQQNVWVFFGSLSIIFCHSFMYLARDTSKICLMMTFSSLKFRKFVQISSFFLLSYPEEQSDVTFSFPMHVLTISSCFTYFYKVMLYNLLMSALQEHLKILCTINLHLLYKSEGRVDTKPIFFNGTLR